jgi:hypothetical protein
LFAGICPKINGRSGAKSDDHAQSVLITNTDHGSLTESLRAREADLDTAQAAHRAIPARLPLALVAPGQQVMDTQTQADHPRDPDRRVQHRCHPRPGWVRTGYARANHEAHTPIRQALSGSGDTSPPHTRSTRAPTSSCATTSRPSPDLTRTNALCPASGSWMTARSTWCRSPGATRRPCVEHWASEPRRGPLGRGYGNWHATGHTLLRVCCWPPRAGMQTAIRLDLTVDVRRGVEQKPTFTRARHREGGMR